MKTIMTLALLCALAQGAWAEAVSYIYYTVDEETHVVTKHTDGSQATYTTISSSQRELRGGWYVVNKNVTINTKERLDCYGIVNIILKDGCTLTVPKGIRVSTDCTLNIYAQSEDEATMGGIHAEGGGEDWAAIGGHKNYRGGTLNIHGGNIYAEAKHNNAAGIGGGNGDGSGMVAINIFGGKVEAHGKSSGAGIGGGQHNNNPGTISIYGGNVTAKGGDGGAGIGGGEDRGGWDTYIYGGTVTATGGYRSAGIGGGEEGDGGNINIYGGTITAKGGAFNFIGLSLNAGAGIGGGSKGDGGYIHIINGTVNATGGSFAAGIGGGTGCNGGTITIDGGTITATSEEGGAGIGGSFESDGGTITINGGTLKAYGSVYSKNHCGSAGIGGGYDGGSGNITIKGGDVYAEGGQSKHTDLGTDGGGPGIGAGNGCSTYNITINGGKVTSHSGQGAPSIGHGITGDDAKKLTGKEGTLILNNNRKVTIWYRHPIEKEKREEYLLKCFAENEDETQLIQYYSAHFSYAVIEGCNHESFLYTVDDENKHHGYCKYCEYETEGTHVYKDGFCTTCGYNHVDYDVTVYRGQYDATGYATHVSYDVVPGRDFAVPAAPLSTPEHMVFKGWKMVTSIDDAPSNWEMTEGEELLEPGTVLMPTADFLLYARYLRNYTTEWEWGADYRSATLKLYNKSTDTTPVATIEASSVTQTPVEATLEQVGSLTSIATANYTSAGGHFYEFTDTQVVPSYYALSLGEEDNASVINTGSGVQVTATLTDRTLWKDDSWNTLCLPFDVVDNDDSDYNTFSGTPLEGAIVKEFESTDFNSTTGLLTLNFSTTTRIKAGRPYLIRWDKPAGYVAYDGANAATCSDIVGPVFTGITLNSDRDDEECAIDDDKSVTFKGTYSKLTYVKENRNILYLGSGNTLYYPAPTDAEKSVTIGAQRAYFQLNGLTAGEPADPSAGVRAFNLNFGDEETGITTTDFTDSTDKSAAWYDLNGRKLSGKPTQKGIYINNGKKVIIK